MKRISTSNTVKRLRPTIVGAGLVALDVVVDHSKENSEAKYYAGGTCGNVLTTLSFLGWNSKPVARLKNDASSKLLLKDLKNWGVDLSNVTTKSDGSTPVIIQNIKESKTGKRSHSFSLRCPCCGAYLPGYKSILGNTGTSIGEEISAHQVFFFDRVSRGTLNLAKASATKGAVVVFEPSGIGKPSLFREAWAISNIVKYSNDRLRDIADLDLQSANNDNLLLEIETLGESGLRYRSQLSNASTRGWRTLKSIHVADFRDAAGSGDWCTAGVIHKLARGGIKGFRKVNKTRLQDALRYGQALATWNCSFDAARGGMYLLTKEQIDRQIRNLLQGKKVQQVEDRVSIKKKDLSHLCPTCESTSFTKTKKRKARA